MPRHPERPAYWLIDADRDRGYRLHTTMTPDAQPLRTYCGNALANGELIATARDEPERRLCSKCYRGKAQRERIRQLAAMDELVIHEHDTGDPMRAPDHYLRPAVHAVT